MNSCFIYVEAMSSSRDNSPKMKILKLPTYMFYLCILWTLQITCRSSEICNTFMFRLRNAWLTSTQKPRGEVNFIGQPSYI